MWKKIGRYYPPVIDLVSFSLLLFMIVYVVFTFGHLPEEIPRHFNEDGDPDAWGGKGMLLVLLVIHFFILTQSWVFNYFLFIAPDDPRELSHFINIPSVKKDELTYEQVEAIRQTLARMMATLNVLISFLFAYMIHGSIQTALGNQNGLGVAPLIIVTVLVAVVCYPLWKIYRIAKSVKRS